MFVILLLGSKVGFPLLFIDFWCTWWFEWRYGSRSYLFERFCWGSGITRNGATAWFRSSPYGNSFRPIWTDQFSFHSENAVARAVFVLKPLLENRSHLCSNLKSNQNQTVTVKVSKFSSNKGGNSFYASNIMIWIGFVAIWNVEQQKIPRYSIQFPHQETLTNLQELIQSFEKMWTGRFNAVKSC